MKTKLIYTFFLGTALLLSSCNGSTAKGKYEKGDDSHLNADAKTTEVVRMHYHRFDNKDDLSNYDKWSIWAWDMTNNTAGAQYDFACYDDYGVYTDIVLNKVSGGKEIHKMGFLVAVLPSWEAKDPAADRVIEVAPTSPGGIYDLYVKSESKKIYYDPITPLKPSITAATLKENSLTDISVTFDKMIPFDYSEANIAIKADGQAVNATFTKVNASEVKIVLGETFDVSKTYKISYKFDEQWTDEVELFYGSYFDSEDFANKYTYTGDDLGVSFDNEANPTRTSFKVFAPTSTELTLNIYDSGDYINNKDKASTHAMSRGEKGVWYADLAGDLTNKYYTYTVKNSLGENEVVDPYAKSAGTNGQRGMVTNFTKLNAEIEGWDNDERPDYGESGVDASIYEIHVRDMTINPNSGVTKANRGKFLGLAEKGTKFTKDGKDYKTGLDHLQELGITHVQIQPFYDYASVDETKNVTDMSLTDYNWGYDPQNYNALEGSYSTNPADGTVRIKEAKQMIMAMHEAGLNITMDVVYNHTAATEASYFNRLVPFYYYHTKADGEFYNGSGCGNEIASERSMVRKFIVDSCKFFTDEYHLSGFRFDLMGLIDNQTMIDVYQAVTAIDPTALVYGEPWTGGSGKFSGGTDPDKLDVQQTVKSSLYQPYFAGAGNYVGAFSDGFRDGVRGSNDPAAGYVQGLSNFVGFISFRTTGTFGGEDKASHPQQVINYVSCHDNYTLYDQIVQKLASGRVLKDAYNHAESLVFTFQGMPFMQEGEDFMRTKAYEEGGKTKYEHNSYNVGDFINNMDYERKADNYDVFQKFQELIALRKNIAELRLDSREEINNKVQPTVKFGNGNFAYEIKGDKDIVVVSALNEGAFTFEQVLGIKEGQVAPTSAKVLYDSTSTNIVGSSLSTLSFNKNQVLVLEL